MAGSIHANHHPAPRRCRLIHAVWLIFFLLIFQLRSPCFADKALTISADEQFRFAETYFKQGAYAQAADEYRRFIYFFPDDARTGMARFRTGQADMRRNDYESAIETFKRLIDTRPGRELRMKSYWQISESRVALGRYEAAVAGLEPLTDPEKQDPGTRDQANYRIGWIYIETGDFGNATRYLDRILPAGRIRYGVDTLYNELAKTPQIERKNPFVAGALSLVPGLGYLYCKRPGDALVSFLVNGVMLAATYAAAKNDNPALAGILGFVELGFYSANIFGATGSAHKFNRRKKKDFIDDLKRNTRMQFSASDRNKGFMVTLQYRF